MLKRLFLSIIILSALTSEGGNYYNTNFINYYLTNLSHLDIVEDSRIALSYFDEQKLSERKGNGIPVAFFKKLSQDALNARASNHSGYDFDLNAVVGMSVLPLLIVTICFLLAEQILKKRKSTILCLTDSSPPLFF